MQEILGQKVNSIFIQKQNNLLNVSISVDPIEHRGKEIRITSSDISQMLFEKGYKITECVQSAVVVNTSNAYFGTWIFKLENDVEKVDLEKKKIRKSS